MTPEVVFGLVMVLALSLGVLSRLLPKRRPKESQFRCARCNSSAPHTERTIAAWRQGKAKFFCQSCHKTWLESQQRGSLAGAAAQRHSQSGCLGVVVVFVVLPAGLFGAASAIGLF